MRNTAALLLISISALLASPAQSSGLAVRLGPPGIGTGGPNPVSIPPAGGDLGLSFVTNKGTEFNASITSFSIANRTQVKAGAYMSLGGGLTFSANGAGFGPYAGFGYEGACSWYVCFTAEYQQAIGLGLGSIIAPSALRMGVIKWF